MSSILRHARLPARNYMCEDYARNSDGVRWNAWRERRRKLWSAIASMSNDDLLDEYGATFCDNYYTNHESMANASFIARILRERLRKLGFYNS